MTLEEARAAIGRAVVYRPNESWESPEEGVITSVSRMFVFVRYGADKGSKATAPGMLELVTP